LGEGRCQTFSPSGRCAPPCLRRGGGYWARASTICYGGSTRPISAASPQARRGASARRAEGLTPTLTQSRRCASLNCKTQLPSKVHRTLGEGRCQTFSPSGRCPVGVRSGAPRGAVLRARPAAMVEARAQYPPPRRRQISRSQSRRCASLNCKTQLPSKVHRTLGEGRCQTTPLALWAFGQGRLAVLFCVLALLLWWKHAPNIRA
jgi:hypothetical protein